MILTGLHIQRATGNSNEQKPLNEQLYLQSFMLQSSPVILYYIHIVI